MRKVDSFITWYFPLIKTVLKVLIALYTFSYIIVLLNLFLSEFFVNLIITYNQFLFSIILLYNFLSGLFICMIIFVFIIIPSLILFFVLFRLSNRFQAADIFSFRKFFRFLEENRSLKLKNEYYHTFEDVLSKMELSIDEMENEIDYYLKKQNSHVKLFTFTKISYKSVVLFISILFTFINVMNTMFFVYLCLVIAFFLSLLIETNKNTIEKMEYPFIRKLFLIFKKKINLLFDYTQSISNFFNYNEIKEKLDVVNKKFDYYNNNYKPMHFYLGFFNIVVIVCITTNLIVNKFIKNLLTGFIKIIIYPIDPIINIFLVFLLFSILFYNLLLYCIPYTEYKTNDSLKQIEIEISLLALIQDVFSEEYREEDIYREKEND